MIQFEKDLVQKKFFVPISPEFFAPEKILILRIIIIDRNEEVT